MIIITIVVVDDVIGNRAMIMQSILHHALYLCLGFLVVVTLCLMLMTCAARLKPGSHGNSLLLITEKQNEIK